MIGNYNERLFIIYFENGNTFCIRLQILKNLLLIYICVLTGSDYSWYFY